MRWSTGKEVSPPNLINLTFNATAQENGCLEMSGHYWNDNNCETVQRFVCERPSSKSIFEDQMGPFKRFNHLTFFPKSKLNLVILKSTLYLIMKKGNSV